MMIQISKLFILIVCLLSCKSNKIVDDFVVTNYKEVSIGYQYSNDIIEYKAKRYKPILQTGYKNSTLFSAETFKSEGKVTYNLDELNKDSQLKKYLGIIDKRTLKVDVKYIEDNNTKLEITEKQPNAIYCISGEKLIVYKY